MAASLDEKWGVVPGMLDALSALRAYQRSLDAASYPDGSDEASEVDRRLRQLAMLFTALERGDPLLITQGVATSLLNNVTNAKTYFDQGGPLTELASHWGVVDLAREFLAIPKVRGSDVLVDARRAAEETATELQAALTILTGTNSELVEENQRLRGAINALLLEKEIELDRVIGEASEHWQRELHAAIEKYEDDRRAFVDAGADAVDEAEEILKKLRATLTRAGDEVLSTGYGQAAQTEHGLALSLRRQAILWGVLAVLAAMAALGLQIFLRTEVDTSGPFLLTLLAPKLAIIAALGALSRYTSHQSAVHLRQGQDLRKIQLELDNLSEYLAEMDEDSRSTMRQALLQRFFGSTSSATPALPAFSESSPP